jgi:hypothetical protein
MRAGARGDSKNLINLDLGSRILRPRIVTTRRLVRFVTGLLGVGIFTLVRLVGIFRDAA